MVKDLVVNLTVGSDRDVAAQFAISIAEAFEAHIAGIAFAYDPVVTPTVMDGLSAATWIESQRSESRGAAQVAIDAFERAARQARLSAEPRLIEASLGSAATLFGRIARRFDLAVVGQRDPDRGTPDDLILEAALLESGRPVAVVPYIQRRGLTLDRVLACWDAGRNAARAMGWGGGRPARKRLPTSGVATKRQREEASHPRDLGHRRVPNRFLQARVERLESPCSSGYDNGWLSLVDLS